MVQETAHYTVLARRFRPQTFDEVVGQQHVAQALRNAIRAGRVAHAYLFTGARGVGKTSMARILAKALNCQVAEDGIPCNTCEICEGIAAGNDVDILEIDGASNRGIDDIRALRANVNVKAMRTRYKVYIVDEVHMLTKEAFNALLKTLEEPPPGVKFVFCTTEPQKVPDTILSRCQRFDFASIAAQRIAERLTQIAEAEGVSVEPAAVDLVARRAGGSMRDSQSLFDQLLSFGGDSLTAADVHRLLGTADDDRLLAIMSAVVKRDQAEALVELDKAIEFGVHPGEVIDQLTAVLRDVMVLGAGAAAIDLIGVSESNRDAVADLASAWPLTTTVAALEILGETNDKMRRSTQSRALAELAVVRLAILDDMQRIADLIAGGPVLAASDATTQKKTPDRVVRTPDAPAASPFEAAASGPSPASSEVTPAVSAAMERPVSVASDESSVQAAVPAPAVESGAGALEAAPDPAPESEREPAAAVTESADPPPPTPAAAVAGLSGTPASGLDDDADPSAEIPTPSSPVVELCAGNESRFQTELVDRLRDTTRDHLRTAALAISGPNHLALTFSRNYHFSKQYCERPEVLGRLQEVASEIAGGPVRIRIDLAAEPAVSPPKTVKRQERVADAEIRDEYVQQAVTIFRGTVVRTEQLATPTVRDQDG